MRFSIQFLMMVMAFVAAFFAGRASLTPIIREHERQNVLQKQQAQIHGRMVQLQDQLIEVFEKQRALDDEAQRQLAKVRREKELQRLDWMIEVERDRNPKIDRPRLLGPGRASP